MAMPGRRRNRSLAAKTVWGAPAWRPPHRQCDPYPQDQLSSRFDKLRRRRTAISAIPADNSPPLRISRPPTLIPVTGRLGLPPLPGGAVPGGVVPSVGGVLGGVVPSLGVVGGVSVVGGGSVVVGDSVVGGAPAHVWIRLNCCVPSTSAAALRSSHPAGVKRYACSFAFDP